VGIALWLTASSAGHAAEIPSESLKSRILAISEAAGFVVSGIEHLPDSTAALAEGDLNQQLSHLLADVNFVLIRDQNDAIARVIITGRRDDAAARIDTPIIVQTDRRGPGHFVTAWLVGEAGQGRSVSLLVDAGASTVVLPKSRMRDLGFGIDDLTETRI
jgi:predicted aspartyl protease